MKTETGNFYIFFNSEDFWKKVNFWKSKNRVWNIDSHPSYNPTIREKDFPCVLNVDDDTMMYGIINSCSESYFSDPFFVKLYNKELRKKKIIKIF